MRAPPIQSRIWEVVAVVALLGFFWFRLRMNAGNFDETEIKTLRECFIWAFTSLGSLESLRWFFDRRK